MHVNSQDGTNIYFSRSGNGRPLVLVHGALISHRLWQPVLPTLEKYATIHAMDRRCHGNSGDNKEYTFEREVEDVVAVVEKAGEDVDLLGHSAGAVLALEASLLTKNIRRLILYEPPLTDELLRYSKEIIDSYEQQMKAGNREGLVSTFLYYAVGFSKEEIEEYKKLPLWQEHIDAAHTLPREERAFFEYRFNPKRFKKLDIPTLLLQGSESIEPYKHSIDLLDDVLPDSRVVTLREQEHVAMVSAPGLFAEEVVKFLKKA